MTHVVCVWRDVEKAHFLRVVFELFWHFVFLRCDTCRIVCLQEVTRSQFVHMSMARRGSMKEKMEKLIGGTRVSSYVMSYGTSPCVEK